MYHTSIVSSICMYYVHVVHVCTECDYTPLQKDTAKKLAEIKRKHVVSSLISHITYVYQLHLISRLN